MNDRRIREIPPPATPLSDTEQRPRILVCDNAATRLGVRIAVEGLVDICAEVGDTAHVIREAKKHQPEICVIGSGTEGGGMLAIRGVCRAAPDVKVIFMTDRRDADDMLDAVRSGAVGYVQSNMNVESLRRIIMAVVADEAILPRTMILDLVREVRAGGGDQAADLTRREVQILGMLRRGKSTSTIADRLGIESVTVRRHISAIVRKLGVADRSVLTDEQSLADPHHGRD